MWFHVVDRTVTPQHPSPSDGSTDCSAVLVVLQYYSRFQFETSSFVETLALAGTVAVLIEFTVNSSLLEVLSKSDITALLPAPRIACNVDVSFPKTVDRVVTRT